MPEATLASSGHGENNSAGGFGSRPLPGFAINRIEADAGDDYDLIVLRGESRRLLTFPGHRTFSKWGVSSNGFCWRNHLGRRDEEWPYPEPRP